MRLRTLIGRLFVFLLIGFATSNFADAHLMVAQRGTLNIVGDGAFMVLSLPVSAFSGVDDDGDGKLSVAEFVKYRVEISDAITRNVQLIDEQGSRPLEGLMLTLAPPDETPHAPANQIVALGRFALTPGMTAPTELDSPMRFRIGLFGKETAERGFQITVTRKTQTQLILLTPGRAQRDVLPSLWFVFADYVVLGAEHVMIGLDHLLFLLLVLSAGWGWRYVFLALTTFSLGHAITLVVSVIGGMSVPELIVEPMIAATIVGLALFDIYARTRERKPSPWLRLTLVFACSLVHGLGLASTLTELGLDKQYRLPSLAGFNVGIEFVQVAIAAGVAITSKAVRSMRGEMAVILMARAATVAAIAVGSGWFVQRVLGTA